MNTRLAELRKALNLTQEQFGEKINLKRTAITAYEKGYNSINDRTMANICKQFNVNEHWLRTGEGDMFRPRMGLDSELVEAVARLIETDNDFTKALIVEYLSLPRELQDVAKEYIMNVVKRASDERKARESK